jgi:hypothetical protein
MLHCRDGVRFPPDVTFGIQAKEFNLGFIRPVNLGSHGLRVFRFLLANSKGGCHVPFTEEWLQSGCSTIKWWSATEMVVLLEGSPLYIEELWSSVSDHRVLGHLPKAFLP